MLNITINYCGELTQAASQNNHKPMSEMQRGKLFHYSLTRGSWNNTEQRRPRGNAGSVRPDGQRLCCLHTFVKGLCTCSLPPRSDLLCGFYDLCFDLSPKAESSSMSVRVPPNLSKHLRHLYTEIWLHKIDRGQTAVGVICGFSPPQFFSSSWHSQMQGHLRESTIPLSFFCF